MSVSPAVVLFFLSAAVAELLSGSAPPSEFFNPFSFVLLSCLYGSGAVLARELKVRWNKGYVSLFVLGAAYAVIEEGLMVKSFFDPTWPDIGFLGLYGRWFEINWVWTEWLTVYHAIFSIALPIALVELAYHERQNQRWVSDKKLVGVAILLFAVTAFGYLALTPYRPPVMQYAFFVAVVAFLVVLAKKLPSGLGKGKLAPPSSRKLFVVGLVVAASLFVFFGAGPHNISSPLVLMVANDNWIEFTIRYMVNYKQRRSTKDRLFDRILNEISGTNGEVALASATFHLVETPVFDVRLANSGKLAD